MSVDNLCFGKFKVLTKTTEETLNLIVELRLNIKVEHYLNYISFYSNSEDYDVLQVKGQYILIRYLASIGLNFFEIKDKLKDRYKSSKCFGILDA